ncbi:MAG: hypothetical protein HRU13_08930 [Phycisphaerales bacterium]|nr:hypothetical protein [Phycisphaerales bacterium]
MPIECPDGCDGPFGYVREGPVTTWKIQTRFTSSSTGECWLDEEVGGLSARWPIEGDCTGSCGNGLIVPGFPLPPESLPGGGDSVPRAISRGRVSLQTLSDAALRQTTRKRCKGCGKDGGL